MSAVLFARIRPAVHDELRQVAELAGLSVARVTDILLADALGIVPPSAGRDTIRRIVNKRKRKQ